MPTVPVAAQRAASGSLPGQQRSQAQHCPGSGQTAAQVLLAPRQNLAPGSARVAGTQIWLSTETGAPAAGILQLPPVSSQVATGVRRAARAAPEPPLLPAGQPCI